MHIISDQKLRNPKIHKFSAFYFNNITQAKKRQDFVCQKSCKILHI